MEPLVNVPGAAFLGDGGRPTLHAKGRAQQAKERTEEAHLGAGRL